MSEKVKITSMVIGTVGVQIPELHFNRTWAQKGASVLVDKDILPEMMYDPGFANMINDGTLYIEDLEVKKELALEPEEATEPVNIIVLDDKDRQKYWTVLTYSVFKERVKKLPHAQVVELANYAVQHRLMDADKCRFIKQISGIDVINAIRLNEDDTKE